MACKYTYKGAEYTEEEFRKLLKSMPQQELGKYLSANITPSAPFVTSTDAWVELGLKQAIRMAVDGGPSPAWADATKPKSIREEFDNHLSPELASVLPLEVVNASVLAASKNDEVRRAIVAAIPVDVVNILSKHGVSPESLVTKSDVFGNRIPVESRAAVARGFADALQLVGTRLRTALDGVLSEKAAGRDRELLPAIRARDLDPGVVAGLLAPSRIYGGSKAGRDVTLSGSGGAGSTAKPSGSVAPDVGLAGKGRELSSAELAVALNRHDAILTNRTDDGKKFEPGYEILAWASGEQQNERYDLSKQVSTVNYAKRGDGKYQVVVMGLDGNQVYNSALAENELEDVVGKEVAKKIVEGNGSKTSGGFTELSGDGLKVGGSGMKGFYDKILPTVAKKVSKRLGGDGKVRDTDIVRGESRWEVVDNYGAPYWTSDSREEAEAYAKKTNGAVRRPKPDFIQQSIAITPEMKAKVSSGVPLMQDAKGAVEFAQGGDAIIRALQEPDASTGIHELAHVARRFLFDRNIPLDQRKGITDDHIKTAEEWSGAKDGNWTREAEEKFARGFERYLRDGNAPNEALKDVFAKFKQWLTEIYRNLFASPVKEMVSPEMRKVFDALVTRGAAQAQQPSQTFVPKGLTKEPVAEAPKPAPVVAEEPSAPPPPPPPVGPKAPKEEGRPMRATAKRVIEQFPELENVLTDDAVYYNRMPHKVSLDAAKAIVEQRGLENAARDIMEGADMPGAVRSMLGRVIMETYRKEGKLEQLADFSEKWFEGITNAAQAISALQTLYGDIYDKEAILFKAQKTVREQRIKQEKAAEHTTRKLIKGLREVNKEAINETLGRVSVKGRITNASTPKKQAPEPRKPRYGEKNRIVTKSAYEAALREMRSQMFSAIIPPQLVVMTAYHIEAGARSFAEVAEQLTKDLGRKALPYLKEAYRQASKRLKSEGLEFEQTPDSEIDEYVWKRQAAKIVEKFDAAVKKGDAKAQKDAIAALQEIAKEEGVWGEYKKYAADRLKRLSEQQIKKDVDADPYLMEFTRGLVANISQQIRDIDPDGKTSKKPARTSIEIIGDAFKNPEKYKEAWEETRKQFADELRGAKAELTKATESGDKERIAKAEARMAEREAKAEALDNYFGEFLPKPFSDALVARAVSQGLKDLDIKIADIVRKHYTVQEGKKRDLIDKLVQDAGLDGAEAAELAKAVGAEFDRIATEKKRQIIARAFPVGERKKPSFRSAEQSFLELTNAGAFSDAELIKRYAESMGFAKLTAEQISTMEGLADAIQRAPEGRPKWEAVQDLLDYQASIKGMTKWELAQSVWYANVLSGPETQSKNFIAGFFKSIGEYTIASSLELVARRSPETTRDLASSLFFGLRKGWLEAGSVMRTGRSPIRSHKVEASATLERLADDPNKFISSMAKGLGKLKYVRRFMESVDTIFYEGTREMRAYQWAVRKARGNPNPSMTIREQALEYMNAGNAALQQAQDQAAMEAQSLIDELNGELDKKAITKTEYDKRVKIVRLNERRRAFELVERGRSEDINEEASRFGSFATYNYVPNGTLGVFAGAINQALAKFPPLRLVIPFTNVISNVANDALDWTPIGAVRSRTKTGSLGASVVESMFDADRAKALAPKLSPEQLEQYKEDQLARAIIGTTAMAAIFMLTQPGDDDEEPALTITGNGYGDPRKNQQLRETGWQPYSIKIGDTWISYQYSPLIMAFGMIGHLRDAEKYRKKKIDDTAMSNVFAAMSYAPTTFFDLSFLSGLSKSLSAATDPRSEEKVKALGEWATRSAKSFVVPNLYTQGHRIYQSIADEPNKDVRDSLVGQLLKDVPFVRDMYPNAYNILGEPIVPYSTSLVSIENDDPVFSLFASKNWMQGLPATPPVYDPSQKRDRVMTPEERAVFYKERGEYIRKVVESNMEQLRKLEGEKFDKAMRSITSKATKRAKGKIVLGADYEPE